MNIFELFGTIAINNKDANNAIDETSGKTEGFAGKLKGAITTAVKFGAAVATGVAAAGTALMKVASSAAAATDRVDKMSQKIGISREAFQELDFICSQSGTSVDTLQGGMKTLTNQMQSAADGTASATAIFDKLGVSIYDSNGALKSQEDMMWDAMSALQGMENQTEKAALANDLFGRSGTELMPLLNGEAGSIEAMKEQAHDLGLVLSDESVDAGVKFTDTIDQLKRSFSAVTTEIGVGIMPIIQKLCDWVLENMPAIQETLGALFSILGTVVSAFGEIMGSVFESIQTSLGDADISFSDVFDRIGEVFSLFWETVVSLWETVGQPIFEALQSFVSTVFGEIGGMLSDTGISFETVFAAIKTAVESCWTVIQTLWGTIGQPIWDTVQTCIGIVGDKFGSIMPEIQSFVSNCFSDIKTFWENNLKPCFDAIGNFIETVLAPVFEAVFGGVISGAVDAAFKFVKDLWEGTLKPVFTGITDFLTGVFTLDFSQAFEGLISIVDGIWQGIVSVVKAPINTVIGVINSFIGGLNKLQVPDWVPLIGGKGINIPLIPLLEEGGVLEKGQIGFLEGNGAEAVVPLEQNKEWISAVAKDMKTVIGGTEAVDVLEKILSALMSLDDGMQEKLSDAFGTMKFDVNNREFARMVKAVG